MTNLEFYKDKILENINNHCNIGCAVCFTMNGFDIEDGCSGIICDSKKMIDWMLKEHKEPIKLKQWEKDLITVFDTSYSKQSEFWSFLSLKNLKQKGYFKGITDTSMSIREILDNCEVEDR